MSIPYFMNYVIFFQDQAEYEFAVAVAGGNLLEITPRDAATLFGIPFPYPSGDMSTIPRGIYFISPFTVGSQFLFPGPSGKFVDDTVLTTTVTAQAGTPASIFPADSPAKDGVFTWSANIVRSAGAGSAAAPPLNACAQRRWITGREVSFESGSVLQQPISRDSSRVIGGCGFWQRGNNNKTTYNETVTQFRTPADQRVSWERFYMRVRALPSTVACGLWRSHGFPSNAAGAALQINTDGTIHALDVDNIGTIVDKGAIFTPTLLEWFRVDLMLRYGSGSPPTVFTVYINGTLVFYANSGMTGMSANSRHDSSDIGFWIGTGPDAECEVDWDDWINADLPTNMNTTQLTFNDANFALDWLLGSHCRVHHGISATQVNWAPAGEAVGAANQSQGPAGRLGTSVVSSGTAGAQVNVTEDMLPPDVPDTLANVVGPISALQCMYSSSSDGSDGQLGYNIAGGADVLATVNQQVAEASQQSMYMPTGVIIPGDITPLVIVHKKSASGTSVVSMLVTVVEYLGVWGPEDDPLFDFPVSRNSWIHNSRYDNTEFGYLGSEPDAPVFAGGFTYVGNGTYQEITLPGPCHFLWIRPLSAPAGGIKFFAASLGAHSSASVQTIGNVRMYYDFLNALYKFSVTGGANSECNVSGTTYQVIFFCDPGMRFNCCTAFVHGSSASTPKVNNLIAAGFTTEFGFITQDFNGTAGNLGFWTRGPGSTGNNITPLNGTAIDSTGMNTSPGVVNSFSTLHQGNGGFSLSLWRTFDNGGGGCNSKMVQIMQYTGNGSSPRTITLTPTSGRVPLFIFGAPASAAGTSFFRDPSHAGANSSDANGMGLNANAFTAVGVDSFTVQSALNANGVVYNIFAICGDTAGMNNGTYSPNYCDGSGPYIPPNAPQGDINVLGNGGIDFDGDPPLTLLRDVSGIYTLVPGKRNDSMIDRQTGQTNVDMEIPDPTFKTGYLGG